MSGVRGPSVFAGYWHPERLQPVTTTMQHGWHMTGDLGRIDAEGWLWFTGRAAHKQLIKTGGENVYSTEVEDVLYRHPAVLSCAVVAKPDAKWGETPLALVIPRGQPDAAALLEWANANLAKTQRLAGLEFRAEFPRNALGKVLKRELRAPWWDEAK